jgi:hypothetical protein
VARAALPGVRPVTSMEFAELLAQARPAERTIRLCLRGDLQARFEELDRQLRRARETEPSSLAGSGAPAIAAQIEALRGEMEQSSVTFRLRALPRRRYQALTEAHPPRRDPDGKIIPDDAEQSVNTSTFWFALARACVVEPTMDDGQYSRLVDEVLSNGQFEALAVGALAVCRGAVDVPFSLAASEILRTSGGGSSAPNGSASASAASTAGSLASPSSATTGAA